MGSDVTVTTENELCIWIGGKGAAVNLYGSLTAGEKNPVVQGNGTNNATTNNGGTEINIYPGAELTSASVAMYLPQSGTTNISGGTVEGYAAIGIKSGTLNITGGTVKGTKNDTVLGDEHSATNGIAYDGSAIVIDSYIGYAGEMNLNISGDAVIQSAYSTVIREIGNNAGATNVVSINISGGTLTGGTDMACVMVRDVTAETVSITGGSFDSDVKDYCAFGYTTKLQDGMWAVVPTTGMAAQADAEGSSVTAEVAGSYTGDESGDAGVEAENNTVAIDVATGEADIENVAVKIAAGTLTSVAGGGVTSVSIETDVGTLTLDQAAWAAVTEGAGGAGVTLAVDASQAVNGIWTITAQANGGNVFEGGGAGLITVSVPYAAGSVDTRVYCTDDGGLEEMETSFAGETLTWSTPHLSTFQAVTLGPDDQCAWSPAGGAAGQGTLAEALEALEDVGGTILLAQDATLDNARYTISKPITITGAGAVTATAAAGETTVAFTLTSTGGLILDGQGVTLTVQGAKNADESKGNDGTAFSVTNGSVLTVRSGATLALQDLERGLIAPATPSGNLPVSAEITVDNATLTADGIDGNFSNGGWYTFENGAQVTLENCGSHALSANQVTVEDSQLTIRGAGYRGISINDAQGKLSIEGASVVTIADCGEKKLNDAYLEAVRLADDADFCLESGSRLSLTGENTAIALGTSGELVIEGEVEGGAFTGVIAVIGRTGYATLQDAVNAAPGNETVTLLSDVTEDVTVPVGTYIFINGQGHTLYGTVTCATAADDSKTTDLNLYNLVLNGDIDGDGENDRDFAVYSADQTNTTVSGLDLEMYQCEVRNYAKKAVYLTNAVWLSIDQCAFENNATEDMNDPNTYGDYTIDLNLMNVQAGNLYITNTTFDGVCGDKAVIKVSARGGESDTWTGQDIPAGTSTRVNLLTIAGCTFNDQPPAAAHVNIGTDSKADSGKTPGEAGVTFAENATGGFEVTIAENVTDVTVNSAYQTYKADDGKYYLAQGDGTGEPQLFTVPAGETANKTAEGDLSIYVPPVVAAAAAAAWPPTL